MYIAVCDDQVEELTALTALLEQWQTERRIPLRCRAFRSAGDMLDAARHERFTLYLLDVLMPGIMEHIERAGVHSGDSIAVYPPYSLTDKMMQIVVDCSEKLALALGTKGLVNIQYLVYQGELFVIEVNPRASPSAAAFSAVATECSNWGLRLS